LDQRGIVGRRTFKWDGTEVGKSCLNFGVGKGCVDLPIELLDNLGGRMLRRSDAIKRAGFIARQEFAMVGTSGRASIRFAVVTASGRTRPTLMCSIDPVPPMYICICPPIRSINPGASPR